MDFDFKYPTFEDAKHFQNKVPNLKQFGFKSFSFEDYAKAGKEIQRIENLHAWDNVVLSTKINHLKKSYLNCLVFHRRGLAKTIKTLDENTRNFVFYLENAFYAIQSIDDIFLQIVNVFYNIDLNENAVKFNKNDEGKLTGKFSKELKSRCPEVLEFFDQHISSVTIEKDVRNSSVHRYPLIFIDRKTIVENKDGKESVKLSSFNNDLPDYQKYLELLETWIRKTEVLQENLSSIFLKS